MEESNPIPFWIRRALIGVGLFLAGAVLSFGYSYRPLHGSMSWKVAELERRIDERNLENMKLGDELARLRSEETTRVDPDTFAQVEKELEKTQRALAQAEKDLSRKEGKVKDANASASRWRKRYEELRDEQSLAAASPPPPPRPVVASSDRPASPSPTSRPAVDDAFEPSEPSGLERSPLPLPAAPSTYPPASPATTERGMPWPGAPGAPATRPVP